MLNATFFVHIAPDGLRNLTYIKQASSGNQFGTAVICSAIHIGTMSIISKGYVVKVGRQFSRLSSELILPGTAGNPEQSP